MIEKILIADDEPMIRRLLEETASRRGVRAVSAASGEEASALLLHDSFQMAFVDLKMGAVGGLDVLKTAREKSPATLVVIMTAHSAPDTAAEAIRAGAFDFVPKPFSPDHMEILLEKGRVWFEIASGKNLRATAGAVVHRPPPAEKTVGSSAKIKEAMRLVRRVAPTDATVLITGESGVGKELVSSEIHRLSDPAGSKPFIRLNCAAVPETLVESELFGHEKGAFTGAAERRAGRFEMADGGTLLLDEISEISVQMQSKLLRVLQESEFERVGGGKTIRVRVRVIATTNRNLKTEIAAGSFREDLYYRLNVFPIHLPPLRERGDDAVELAVYFLALQEKKLGRELRLTPPALELVRAYHWPGNIRELQHIIERLSILEDGPEIGPEAFPDEIRHPSLSAPQKSDDGPEKTPEISQESMFDLRTVERLTIKSALLRAGGNKTKAAEMLGFSSRTLRNKLNEYKTAGVDDELAKLCGDDSAP